GRPVHENAALPDIFGLKELQKEPNGPVQLASLKARVSRRVSLYRLPVHYANGDWAEERNQVKRLLEAAVQRLAAFELGDSLAQPRLMAAHALNLLDPSNYKEEEREREDGSI